MCLKKWNSGLKGWGFAYSGFVIKPVHFPKNLIFQNTKIYERLYIKGSYI